MKIYCNIIKRNFFKVCVGEHPRDYMIIVLDGGFECEICKKKYTVGVGDVFIFRAGEHFSRSISSPLRCISVQFDRLPDEISSGFLDESDRLRAENTKRHLLEAIERKDDALAAHLAYDLIVMRGKNGGKEASDTTVMRCIEIIEQNIDREINLSSLASELYISEQGLIARFKRHTRLTPIDYLLSLRIERAKTLLAETELSIEEIATSCGYASVYYFSGAFKKRVGLSPLQYRKSIVL